MLIGLGVNYSERNKLDKQLSSFTMYPGTLRDITSIINPIFTMEIENPTGYNYAYIPDFNRYYYIEDIVSVRYNLWRFECKVDVLESYKDYIVNIPIVLSDTETTGNEVYLPGNVWKTKVKEFTDILTFPNGLSNTGEFILITAGG